MICHSKAFLHGNIWVSLIIFSPKLLVQSKVCVQTHINTVYNQMNGKLKNSLILGQRAVVQCKVCVQSCVQLGLGLSLIVLQGTVCCLELFHGTELYWRFGEGQMINAGTVGRNKQILLIHYGIVDVCTNSGKKKK